MHTLKKSNPNAVFLQFYFYVDPARGYGSSGNSKAQAYLAKTRYTNLPLKETKKILTGERTRMIMKTILLSTIQRSAVYKFQYQFLSDS